MNLDTPLWQLTAGEFLELMNIETKQPAIQIDTTTTDSKYQVFGLGGISELLGCSKATANRIKQSGIINDAITQVGKIIVVDAEKALELIAKHKKQEELDKYNLPITHKTNQ